MKLKRRKLLFLEQLEDRLVPANVTLASGNLTVNGPIHGAIAVAQQPSGAFNVTEGGNNLGTYAVTGNLTINTSTSLVTVAANRMITVTLDPAHNLAGNLSITAGNLSYTVSVDASAAAPTTGAKIGGFLSINAGNGAGALDTINIGATNGLIVGGLTQLTGGTGNHTVTIGNGTNATTLRGDVVATNMQTFNLGAAGATTTTVAGNLIISNSSSALTGTYTLDATSTIGKSLTIVGSAAADNAFLNGAVDGATNLTLGNGANTLETGSVGTSAFFAGAFNYSGGSGVDLVRLHTATFGNNVSLNMGEGDNQYTVSLGFTVTGSMSITAGNGDNNVGAFGGTVGGNLYVTFGSGTNIFFLNGGGTGGLASASVGGKVVYNSGNGPNTFQVSTNGTSGFTLNINFGTDADTFTLTTPADAGLLTGFLNWGDGGPPFDTLNDAGGVFTPDWAFLTE